MNGPDRLIRGLLGGWRQAMLGAIEAVRVANYQGAMAEAGEIVIRAFERAAAELDPDGARPQIEPTIAGEKWLQAWLPLDSLNPPSLRYGLNQYGRREVTLVWWHQGKQYVWAACRDTHEKALAEVLSHAFVWPPPKADAPPGLSSVNAESQP